MKKQVKLALAGVAVGVVSLVAMRQGAMAQVNFAQVNFPTTAKGISDGTFMARAMDPCTNATVTVLTQGSPSAGCYQTNGNESDNTIGMTFVRLHVTQRGRIVLFGKGFKLGDELRLRLTLRVTKQNVNTLGGAQTITFPDMTVDCPKPVDAFNARPNGALIGTTTLAQCLSPNQGLIGPNTNIELLDVSLVNILNNKIVAVPGIVRPGSSIGPQ